MGFLPKWLGFDEKIYEPVKQFSLNTVGRDFVVGDLHGMFSALRTLLQQVGFDPERDRLFSLGDLIDRGAESAQALEWWSFPWFFAILGNHEDMLIRRKEMGGVWHANGGQWWMRIPLEQQKTYEAHAKALPLAMTIATNTGAVGLVHADLVGDDWEQFCQQLQKNDAKARQVALWSRKRIDGLQRGDAAVVIQNVNQVFIGHTVVSDCLTHANIHFIDTGACYLNSEHPKLTLVQIQPQTAYFSLETKPV